MFQIIHLNSKATDISMHKTMSAVHSFLRNFYALRLYSPQIVNRSGEEADYADHGAQGAADQVVICLVRIGRRASIGMADEVVQKGGGHK